MFKYGKAAHIAIYRGSRAVPHITSVTRTPPSYPRFHSTKATPNYSYRYFTSGCSATAQKDNVLRAFSRARRPYLVSMLNAVRPSPWAPDDLRSPCGQKKRATPTTDGGDGIEGHFSREQTKQGDEDREREKHRPPSRLTKTKLYLQ